MVGAIELGRSNWEAVSDGDNWWDTLGDPRPAQELCQTTDNDEETD